MIRPALALIAMTLPAYADTAHRWGTSSVTLSPADGPAVARLDYFNGQAKSAGNPEIATLTYGDLTVQVWIDQGPDDKPDTYTVIAPEGFIAVPQTGVVDEETGVVIEIFAMEAVGV